MTEEERFYAMAHQARVDEILAARKAREAPEVPRNGEDRLPLFWIVYFVIAILVFFVWAG